MARKGIAGGQQSFASAQTDLASVRPASLKIHSAVPSMNPSRPRQRSYGRRRNSSDCHSASAPA